MKCPNCSTENREGAKFCDECGFPLTGMIAQAAQEEAILGCEDTAQLELDFDDETLGDTGPRPVYIDIEEDPVEEVQDIEVAEKEVAKPAPVKSIAPDPSITVDLSGLDASAFAGEYGERIVLDAYKSSENAFRDGSTMEMPRIEGEEPAKRKEFFASSTKKKNPKNRRMLFAALGIVAVIALVAFATYSMELWGGKSVPNVVGMTQADAAGVITEKGFTVRTMQVKSDETEGLVLVMDPRSGARLQPGEEVVIHIATARLVPDIEGKTLEEAKAALEAEGYTNVLYKTESSDEEEGTVLDITPDAGARVKSATEITVVSAVPYRVPDISGMYLDEAMDAIEDAGLNPIVVNVNSEDYPDGSIIGTDPSADSIVKGGEDVYIQIAVARAAKLEEATKSYLAPGEVVYIGGYNYEVVSLDSYSYEGDGKTSYSITAIPIISALGETVYLSARTVSGEILWSDDNTLIEIY